MNFQALRFHLSASLPPAATGNGPKITFHFQLQDENRFQESLKRVSQKLHLAKLQRLSYQAFDLPQRVLQWEKLAK